MRGFTSNTIARVKAQKNRFLTQTCDIEARASTTDAAGFPDDTWSTVATSVSCRVTQITTQNARTMSFGEQETIEELYELTVTQGTDLKADYRITIGTDVYHVVTLVRNRTDEVAEQAIIQRAASTL